MPSSRDFFDVFAGTGVVASAFIDKKIITNDILYSNYISHIAWFKNQEFNQEKTEKILKQYNSIDGKLLESNYMSVNFANTYYCENVCKKIGYIREDIECRYINKDINEKEYAILITSLLYAMDKIANTCGHYDAWRRTDKLAQDITLEMLDIFFNTNFSNKFYNTDSNKIAKQIKCDIAYLDPPYNSRQYCDAYHLLENVARWEKPEVFGVAKKMNRDALKSDYCKTSAAKAFSELVNSLDCKCIILSYNNTSDTANDRSNSKITDKEILDILERKGETKVYSYKYKAFTTGKSHNENNEERLFVCKVRNKKNTYISSPLNYTGGKQKLLPQILPLFPSNISTFVDLFCGGCNVGINVEADKHIYNDNNEELIGSLKFLSSESVEDIIGGVKEIIHEYKLSDTANYGYEKYACNSSSGLGTYNSEGFILLRSDFNSMSEKSKSYYLKLYTLIIFSFNNQIRFNRKGNFNLSVGKRDFNLNMQKKLTEFNRKIKSQNAIWLSVDFREYDYRTLDKRALIYIDPPYFASTASYNENGGWTKEDELDLLYFLDSIHSYGLRFSLSNVLENNGKSNEYLRMWIEKNQDKYYIHELNYSYNNSNYHRKNSSQTKEVLITNYL